MIIILHMLIFSFGLTFFKPISNQYKQKFISYKQNTIYISCYANYCSLLNNHFFERSRNSCDMNYNHVTDTCIHINISFWSIAYIKRMRDIMSNNYENSDKRHWQIIFLLIFFVILKNIGVKVCFENWFIIKFVSLTKFYSRNSKKFPNKTFKHICKKEVPI